MAVPTHALIGVATRSGKSEKVRKTKKNDKSQDSCQKSGNLTKFEKTSDFVSLNKAYKIPYYLKPSNGKK